MEKCDNFLKEFAYLFLDSPERNFNVNSTDCLEPITEIMYKNYIIVFSLTFVIYMDTSQQPWTRTRRVIIMWYVHWNVRFSRYHGRNITIFFMSCIKITYVIEMDVLYILDIMRRGLARTQ